MTITTVMERHIGPSADKKASVQKHKVKMKINGRSQHKTLSGYETKPQRKQNLRVIS